MDYEQKRGTMFSVFCYCLASAYIVTIFDPATVVLPQRSWLSQMMIYLSHFVGQHHTQVNLSACHSRYLWPRQSVGCACAASPEESWSVPRRSSLLVVGWRCCLLLLVMMIGMVLMLMIMTISTAHVEHIFCLICSPIVAYHVNQFNLS